MPISSLLNNLIGVERGVNDPAPHSFEASNVSSRVNERSDGCLQNVADLTLNFINHEKVPSIEVDEAPIEQTFLKCVNYHPHDTAPAVAPNAKLDQEDNIDRVLTNSDGAPCLICSGQQPDALKHSLMNMLCKKLCDESCNTSTKTCQSNDDIVTCAASDEEVKTVPQRRTSSRQEFLASMLDEPHEDDPHVVPLTMENLKQFDDNYFREKLAIAEALANTSMMTSQAAKSRLAARKIEMSLNTPDFVYDPENAEYIPPRELLMYLVR